MQIKFIEEKIMVKIMVQNNGKNKIWNPEKLPKKGTKKDTHTHT